MSKFLTLQEYLKYAEIIIKKWGPIFLINDEDAIADIAHDLIKADERFNGCGDRLKYMLWCGRLKVKKILRSKKKKIKFSKLTKDIPCSQPNHEDVGMLYDFIDFAEANSVISKKHYNCIIEKYIYGRTTREIANIVNMSHERVSFYIKDGIKKLRSYDKFI